MLIQENVKGFFANKTTLFLKIIIKVIMTFFLYVIILIRVMITILAMIV